MGALLLKAEAHNYLSGCVGKQRWWQAGRAVGHPQSTTRYRATQQLANGTACERDESHFVQLSSSRLFQPPCRWLSLIKMHGPAALLCIQRLKFFILFFSLVALSFAEFLLEGGLYLFRDVRGNYYPISSPFCLINGGLIACSVGKCILSAAYFIARHISTLAHILFICILP